MRKLVWPDYAINELEQTVAVLKVINPHGCSAPAIQAHVQREFDAGLTSYVGTGGWYVTVYKAPGTEDTWHPKVSLMTFSVRRYLIEHRMMGQ
jgi:hypothetical protein